MIKTRHEVRDAIHGFIEFGNLERQVIDSRPFQRMRYIHQLSLTYQVYPGATHRRFEHSLGVMEVATRIYDRLLNERLVDPVREAIANEIEPQGNKQYWRSVVRMAALLHDVGHLPFSHAAEADLLPEGWSHERLTAEIIRNSEVAEILRSNRPPIDPEDVVAVAHSLKDRLKSEPEFVLDSWRSLLNEIITGNTFGADRIDYLLRDSHHVGVAYGRFDPDRLISGLRLVSTDEDQIAVGLDIGSIHAAEALLLARYFMYTQVYFHDVRRAYDQHLQDFLAEWLPNGAFSGDWTELLPITDNEVLVALAEAANSTAHPLNELAERIMKRKHFRTVYTLQPAHKKTVPTIFEDMYTFARDKYGGERIRVSRYGPKSERKDFPVLNEDGTCDSSLEASSVIAAVPDIEIGFIFAHPTVSGPARTALDKHLKEMLRKGKNGL